MPGIKKPKPGMYILKDEVTSKMYVGSAANTTSRKSAHFTLLRKDIHPNRALQEIYNNNPNLTFVATSTETRESAYELEQAVIDHELKNGNLLNIATDVRYSGTGRKMSDELKDKIRQSSINREVSQETREKLSQASMGHKRNVGKVRTEEFKQHLSTLFKGKTFTEETRTKIGNALRGRIFSEQHREKISLNRLGTTLSEETKRKISEATKGIKKSPETIEKMKLAAQKRIISPEKQKEINDKISEAARIRKEIKNNMSA